MSSLDPRIEQGLRSALDAVARRGDILPQERLQAYYAAFRDRFGPDKLKSLDGPALLQAMHTHGNKESLVYWLEFKNDEEFPGQSSAVFLAAAPTNSAFSDARTPAYG